MTPAQREAINKLDSEESIRKQISTVHASNHPDKAELIEALEKQLDALNVDAAMVEMSEIKVGEI